jgi:predicted nucleotide-binding protein (sugar kinase/HSP70/actin superfamily)
MKIGILRCLLYYPFYPFWQSFFNQLGFEIVLSPLMTGKLFDHGHRRFVGDICLPIESAFKHTEAIKDDVDLIFIPRVNRLHKDVYLCPACAGLPYVIPRNMPEIPDVLSVNLTPFLLPDRSDMKTFRKLGISAKEIKSAFFFAQLKYFSFVEEARKEPHLDVAIAKATGQVPNRLPSSSKNGPRVLLLGMPYLLGDSFVNQGIPHMLAARKCRLITPIMISPELANQEIDLEGYKLYWTFGGMSIGAMTRLIADKAVDAVIYCSSFACGVDSLITPIVQSACRRCYNIPFLQLVLDEHAEASHIEVRIEAFLDCVEPEICERKAIS